MKSTKIKQIIIGTVLLIVATYLMSIASAETIRISSPSDGAQFSDQQVSLYASVSNSSLPTPFIKFSYNPSQGYPMTEWGPGIYMYNINFSDFPEGSWSILAYSLDITDSINVTITAPPDPDPTPTPTPTSTPLPLKQLSIIGLLDGSTYYNDSMFVQAIEVNNDTIVHYPTWKIWANNHIVNSGTGYYSGRILIEWIEDMGTPLNDGGYLIQISAPGYEMLEYLVFHETPAIPEITLPKLTIYNLDTKVTDTTQSWVTVLDENNDLVQDVVIKVTTRDGTVALTENTSSNGRALLNWSSLYIGQFVIEFTHPDFKKSVWDVSVSASTPPSPVFTASPSPPAPISQTPSPTEAPPPTTPPVTDQQNPQPATVPATKQESTTTDYLESKLPWLLVGLMGLGIVVTKYPQQSRQVAGAGMSALSKLTEKGRDAKDKIQADEPPICHIPAQLEDGSETQCINPVIPGTNHCQDHTPMQHPTPHNGNGTKPASELTTPLEPDTIPDIQEEINPLDDLAPILSENDTIEYIMNELKSGRTYLDIQTMYQETHHIDVPDEWLMKIEVYMKSLEQGAE